MTPAEPVSIRPAEAGDLPAILELVRLSLGPGSLPKTAEFWDWKHRRNPFGPSACLVAESGGELVGVRIFLRWRWRSGEREVTAVRAVDTATHPEWRGRGIFSLLTRRLLADMERQGVAFVFNTPNRFSLPGYLKMGWRMVGRLPLLARPLRGARALPRLLGAADPAPAAAPPLADAFPTMADLLARPELERWLGEWAAAGDGRYQTQRATEYLAWRYRDAPGLDYRAVWDASKPACAALIFRSRWRRGRREILLSEVLTSRDARGIRVAVELLRQLARDADADYLLAAAARGTAERRALRGAGFVALPGLGPRLAVRELEALPHPPDPKLSTSWRFAIGDFEVF